jgi:hypothetical protein
MHQVLGGQFYDNGTFYYDGRVTLANEHEYIYLIQNVVKGYFNNHLFLGDGVKYGIGEVADYNKWLYKTKCGVTVAISYNGSYCHIVVNLDDNFVHFNVFPDNSSITLVSTYDFKMIADSIDFSLIH